MDEKQAHTGSRAAGLGATAYTAAIIGDDDGDGGRQMKWVPKVQQRTAE